MKPVRANVESATVFETRTVLRAISELVEVVLAGRDDETDIRSKLASGTASLRFGFDSVGVISIGLKTADGRLEPLDAVFADGHAFAGRASLTFVSSSREAARIKVYPIS